MVQRVIRVFYCIKIHPNPNRHWVEDTNTICFEQEHMLLAAAAVPVMLLCFGFPAYLFCMLYSNRMHLSSQEVLKKFSFFYKDYSERAPYWEVVVYMRKASIAAIAVLGRLLDVQVQGYLAIFTLFVALLLQSQINPYTNLELNQLEVMSIGISIMLFIATGLVENLEDSTILKITLAWLCVAIIVAYMLYIAHILVPLAYQLLGKWWESSGCESTRKCMQWLRDCRFFVSKQKLPNSMQGNELTT